jgi:hypothetical protein
LKKYILLVLFGSVLLASNDLLAKEYILRTNILCYEVGLKGLELEKTISDRHSLSVDFWTGSASDFPFGMLTGKKKADLLNLRLLFRQYEKADQRGLFYAVGISHLNVNYSSESLLGNNNGIALDLKVGLQDRLLENIVISSTLGLMYFIVPINKTVGSESGSESMNITSLLPNVGLNIGLNF